MYIVWNLKCRSAILLDKLLSSATTKFWLFIVSIELYGKIGIGHRLPIHSGGNLLIIPYFRWAKLLSIILPTYIVMKWENDRSNTQIETLSFIETMKRRTQNGTHNPITGFQSITRLTWTNTTTGLNCPQDSGHLHNTPRYGCLREGLKGMAT